MEEEKPPITENVKFTWKWKYTLLLLFNAGYIVLFYYIMKTFGE